VLKKVVLIAGITLTSAAFPAASISKLSHGSERSQGPGPQRSLNLVGEIMDSRCAIDGSHERMMRQNGLKNAKDCTLQCARSGGSFVLFDPETKTVYQLDDQQKPEPFAGQRVRVSGTYDENSKTMHIESIQSAE
jgi:hypothetical protein